MPEHARSSNRKSAVATCYLCGQAVDGLVGSRDHVIPRAILGKRPPKVRGFDYGGVLPTHPECNNRFGDETYVRMALQLMGALHDSSVTLVQPAPGNQNGRVLALNEEKLTGFGPRDFRFFGIHDARNESMANLGDPGYYADKPPADIRKTVMCTTLSVLAKSAAALLVKRYLAEVPSKWDVVCVPYLGDSTGIDLSSFFEETKPFAEDIRVWTRSFEANSWILIYAANTVTVCFFFLMDDDCNLVVGIQERFPLEECLEFRGEVLMDLVGHDWPSTKHARSIA